MRLQVLHIEDCPNGQLALDHTRAAAQAEGLSPDAIEFVRVESREQAAAVGFAGSPTITADGLDLFPDGARTADLACRVYASSEGLAGAPAVADIARALRALLEGLTPPATWQHQADL